ncbi:uncharacterized protein LY89DRAFT_714003 [Mollisia scopiformis]|uniref:Uncharacterized protein n=1 Tax=Mollisia scopiformis TaxID=149040 RepID=A0A194XV45_MOLSC|nr:uncharacterized protein LY89DRAFT_714003 [Mollisia scopiformis]KUJ23582.1 hypothetical protein LY89DRAFT_714003 [Mollisia scopiformis]
MCSKERYFHGPCRHIRRRLIKRCNSPDARGDNWIKCQNGYDMAGLRELHDWCPVCIYWNTKEYLPVDMDPETQQETFDKEIRDQAIGKEIGLNDAVRFWTFGLWSGPSVAKIFTPRFEPLPECSECIGREDALAPGIGFDLTDSYGAAAIRYHNKSTLNLGKVEANQEYKELVERLSDPFTKISCHSTTWQEVHCSYLHLKRRLNKLCGRPATRDVGILANLMSQLRTLADSHLGAGTTKSVLPTMPSLPGLQEEDLRDALQHIGLRTLVTHKHLGYVWETSAVLAGMGFGLCEHPENCDQCEVEEADMPFLHVLALSLTNRSFSAAYTYTQSAFQSYHEAESVRFELGLENEGEEAYWDRIRDVIVGFGQMAKWPLNTPLLLGEGAGHSEFVKIVQDALFKLNLEVDPVSDFGNREIHWLRQVRRAVESRLAVSKIERQRMVKKF